MTKVTFPNGVTYYTDSALAIAGCGILARANIDALESWGEEEYGSDFLERTTHHRMNMPENSEWYSGAYPTRPLVFANDGRLGADAAAWVREDVWQRWELQTRLESYPILDEKKYAIHEALARQEAFQYWIMGEVESAMEKAGFSDDEIARISGAETYQLFLDSARDADAEWIEQSGGDMWIDVEKVLPVFLSAARNKLAAEATI